MGNKNINSFSENVNKLVNSTNNIISMVNGINETFISDNEVIDVSVNDTDIIQLPSYQNILNRLKNVENVVESFTSGRGIVKIDGTNREIKVETLPNVPQKITEIETPTNFKINSNWFFENLLFPKLTISIDLVNKIDNDSDRVYISRIIIPLNDNNKYFYEENIHNKNLSYEELLLLLNQNDISYFEDVETIYFPLKGEEYNGNFLIKNIEIVDGKRWFYLDNTSYKKNGEENSNLTLKKGDTLRYNNSLYIIDIINNDSIFLKSKMGLETPKIGDVFQFYTSPTQNKNIEIPIGVDEINCIYLKGVNEKYNLIGNDWSDCVSFISNELLNENGTTLKTYYQQYVSDFGAEWISLAKEKKIPAYNGIIPNTPTLNASDFKVVQINTQVNATIDKNKLTNLSSQITTLKSSINSSRNTISKLKNNLTTTTLNSERFKLQNLITNEELQLSTNTSEYKSLVNELEGFVKESGVITIPPKYRIRGFFPIPEPKYTYDENNNLLSKQEVIGFDIKYRYIKKDETGVELGTYLYRDGDSSINAIFSDWNIISSPIKEKVYNEKLDIFEWVEENVGDGNTININQVDIPINDGEKVEIMIRSISEAGYPNCPLKSNWSNSVIISFPNNLTTTNKITNLLDDVKSDSNSIKLDDVLNSAGFYSHISDEIVASDDNTKIYHHDTENIAFKEKTTTNGSEVINTISLYTAMEKLQSKINTLNNTLNEVFEKINVIDSNIMSIDNRLNVLEGKNN